MSPHSDLRILVTGGAGYIGSITTRALLDAGHAVVALDSLERGHRVSVDARASLVVASVGDAGALDAVLPEVDAVVHVAGYIDVAESQVAPELYYRKNVQEPSVLLERMDAHGVRALVFSSTAAVYGEPTDMPIREDAPCAPVNAYGATKLAFEKAVMAAEASGSLQAVRLRYFNVAGAWPDGSLGEAHDPESHIVPRLLAAAAAPGGMFTIFGDDYPTPDGTCVRDYIHVIDLADAHLAAVEYLAAGGAGVVCNLGSGSGYSNREVADNCMTTVGHEIPTDVGSRRPGDPAILIASNDRAAEVLGWRPRRDLQQMLADAWLWHRTHPNGYATRA